MVETFLKLYPADFAIAGLDGLPADPNFGVDGAKPPLLGNFTAGPFVRSSTVKRSSSDFAWKSQF